MIDFRQVFVWLIGLATLLWWVSSVFAQRWPGAVRRFWTVVALHVWRGTEAVLLGFPKGER